MATVSNFLPIQNPSVTDKRADTTEHTVSALVVQREVIGIGSPDNTRTANIAEVLTAAPVAADPGLVVRAVATVASPIFVRLSDGAASYDGTKTGQLPAALVGGRLDANIGAWLGSTAPTVGSKTSVNSVPVVIASDQGNVPVSQATASSLNAQVVGNVAHDAVESGNPVSISGIARTANPTAVAALDRAEAMMDTVGRQIVYPFHPRDLQDTQHTQIASSSAETTIVTAVASEHHDITHIVITNQTATAVNCTIKDATAGTTRAIFALAASGGITIPFTTPWIQKAAVNNNWTCTLSSAAVTVNILVNFIKVL